MCLNSVSGKVHSREQNEGMENHTVTEERPCATLISPVHIQSGTTKDLHFPDANLSPNDPPKRCVKSPDPIVPNDEKCSQNCWSTDLDPIPQEFDGKVRESGVFSDALKKATEADMKTKGKGCKRPNREASFRLFPPNVSGPALRECCPATNVPNLGDKSYHPG